MGTKQAALVNPPFRVWVVGEFARAAQRSHAPLLALSQANFTETLRGLNLVLTVPDPTADSKSKRELTLPIGALADFSPTRLAPHVPYLAPLVRAREVIVATQQNTLTIEQCRESLKSLPGNSEFKGLLPAGLTEQPPSPKVAAEKPKDQLDSLFDLVDAAPPALSKADALIADIIGSGSRRPNATERELLNTALRNLDQRLAELGDTLLAQPAIRKVESAWRGLAELVKHLPRDGSVELRALDSDDAHSLDTFTAMIENGDDQTQPSLVLFARALENSRPDMTWLDTLSRQAQTFQVPCIVSLDSSFFGEGEAAKLSRSEALANRFDTPKFDLWNALRAKDRARWVVCAHNRYLQRPAFNTRAAHSQPLWGSPGWLVAALAIRSHGSRKWPTQIYQPGGEQIEDLPLHPVATFGGEDSMIPLEHPIGDTLCNDLSLQGILPLQCVANRDRVFVTRAPSLLRPRHYGDASANVQSQIMSSFPYQLLTARVAQLIQCNRTALLGDRHPSEVSERLENYLYGLVRDSGRGAKVEVQLMANPDNPSRMMVTLSVQMGRDILNGADIELTLEL